MNPSHPSGRDDELYFQISSANYSPVPILTTQQDRVFMDATPSTNVQMMGNKGKRRKQDLPNTWGSAEDENKKWMHKETEKKRRQEMTTLCSTFRSLLPFEYIKGKRSVSDHVHAGTNYIKHLENKLKQLQGKRDELVKLSNSNPVDPEIGSLTIHLAINVIVHPFPGGVQIECSYNFKKYVFPLSRVLDIVLKEGLNVINSASIKNDDRFIHTIQSEDPHMMSDNDYTELQRKITEAISSSRLEETVWS